MSNPRPSVPESVPPEDNHPLWSRAMGVSLVDTDVSRGVEVLTAIASINRSDFSSDGEHNQFVASINKLNEIIAARAAKRISVAFYSRAAQV